MSRQSKTHSLMESLATTGAGMVNAVVITQLITDLSLGTNIMLTCILTCTSIVLKYGFRRMFDGITNRKENKMNVVINTQCGKCGKNEQVIEDSSVCNYGEDAARDKSIVWDNCCNDCLSTEIPKHRLTQ